MKPAHQHTGTERFRVRQAIAIRRGPRGGEAKRSANAQPPELAPRAGQRLDPVLPLLARLHVLLVRARRLLAGGLFKPKRRRKLQLLEMQQLGEKRFVAVVRVGKQKFLIGGAATSVSLLAEIQASRAKAIAPRPLGEERA